MPARRAVYVAPFDELVDPRVIVELAVAAEERGWHGFFLWDHIAWDPPVRAVADPWVVLAAVAHATSRIMVGPQVTPVPRRRPQKLARETATLQRLSGGRLIFGAGLGGDRGGELSRYGEELDPRVRAEALDAGLRMLQSEWRREPAGFVAPPVWLGARWPARRPLRRAVHYDGLFPVQLPGPDALAELVAEVHALRGPGPFDFAVSNPPDTDPEPWAAAGATWCLTGFGASPSLAAVGAAIAAGP